MIDYSAFDRWEMFWRVTYWVFLACGVVNLVWIIWNCTKRR